MPMLRWTTSSFTDEKFMSKTLALKLANIYHCEAL